MHTPRPHSMKSLRLSDTATGLVAVGQRAKWRHAAEKKHLTPEVLP